MKYIKSIMAISILVSMSSFAATEITQQQSTGYVKVGDVIVSQAGKPTFDDNDLAQAADKMCQESNEMKAENCFYVIKEETGKNPGYQEFHLDVFKKMMPS